MGRDDYEGRKPQVAALPMIGRDRALSTLAEAWDRVRDRPRVVVVTGDPGAGKSRLVAEALSAPHPAPAAVLTGRARAVAPAPYDWLASALDGHPLDGLPGPPEALAWLTQRPSAHRYEPGALLRLAVDVVRHRLGDRPGVLVVEDLHHLDPASLNLVADLAAARNLPALLLVTCRPTGLGEHTARVLTRLSGALDAERCHLGPFTPAETAALIEAGLGTVPEPYTVLRTHRRTGGNPRWLTELITAVRGGDLPALTARPLPAYLTGLAAGHLDGATARVAQAAALLGGRADGGVLAEICGEDAEPALRRLLAAGVLRDTADGSPRFASPIAAEALAQTAPASLRDASRAAAAAHAEERGDEDGAVRYALAAGHDVSGRVRAAVAAHLDAGRARAALSLVDAASGGGVPPSALLPYAARAAASLGHVARAAAFARHWRDAPADPADRVEATRVHADLCAQLGRGAAQHRLLEAIAPSVPPEARARYLTSLSWAALCAERPAEAVRWAEQALDVADAPDAAALTALGHAYALTGEVERGTAMLATGRRYAAARRDLVTFGRAVGALAAVRLPGLAVPAARRLLDESLAALDRHGLGGRAGPAVTAAASAALARGDTARAAALAADRLPVETDPVERAVLTALAGRVAAETGDPDRAAALRERFSGETAGMDLPRVRRHGAGLDLALAAAKGDGPAAAGALEAFTATADPLLHAAELAWAAATARDAGAAEPNAAAELTAREREVLGCLTEGMTNRQVATRLGISIRTVAVHVSNLLRKTGSASRTEAALWAVHRGIGGVRP